MSGSNCNLVTSLLPGVVIEAIENEGLRADAYKNESTQLLLNTVTKAVEAWADGQLKEFDPNPGDGGCQLRGYLVHNLFDDIALKGEMRALKEKAVEVKNIITQRREEFFITKKMEFVLQCYLLWKVKKEKRTLENGIVETTTSTNLLSKLSQTKKFLTYPLRKQITDVTQARLSALSVALLREEISGASLLEEKEHVQWMLSKTKEYTPDSEKYPSKTFGCLFYEYKAIMPLLRQKQALVGFKSIVKDGKPFLVLLQAEGEKKSFRVVPDAKYSSFASRTPIVIFEGVTSLARDAFATWIAFHDFSRVILSCGAIEPPYQPKSKLSEIKNKKAIVEIGCYRKFYSGNIVSKLKLDHVYCNTLQEELRSIQ